MTDSPRQNIHLMSDILASQVAAGEVVERPASVVKELVENSIDAGARSIRVEIRKGGISLIKVSDDGSGMSKEDAAICLQRHATSKLIQVEDLFAIQHLGFRGEALPSIASVSQLTLTTRLDSDIEGWSLSCDGGIETPMVSAGRAPGTEISVSNLFFNTPVRRKFLKSEETEAGHVEHQVRLHALAFPHIRFTYVRDGQQVFDVSATHDLRFRIADFVGRETAASLMRIRPTDAPGVRISGYLMPLSAARRNRRMQFVFLNGRPIEDQIINRAVRDGYGGFPPGLHPALFLYLEVDPSLVDVNVHPAKREVRFRRPSDVTLAVMDAVAATLAAHARGESEAEPTQKQTTPAPEAKPEPPQMKREASSATSTTAQERQPVSPPPAPRPILKLQPLITPRQQELNLPPVEPPSEQKAYTTPTEPPVHLPNFRHMGILQNQYVLFENKEGLVIMNPRAARERIIFERLQASHKHPLVSQRLLVPELIELDTRDMGLALEIKPQLEQAGFQVSPFGRNTLRVEAVPSILPLSKVSDFVQELLRTFTSGEVRINRSRTPFEPFARQLARQYAQQEDMRSYMQNPLPVLAALLECEIPYCSPGGKATLIPFTMNELNRRFQNS